MRNLLIAILVLLVHFSYADAFYLDNESIYASTVNIGYFPNLGNSVSYESFKTQIGATYAVWTNVDIGSLFTYLYNNVSSVKSNNYTIQLDVVYNFAQFEI